MQCSVWGFFIKKGVKMEEIKNVKQEKSSKKQFVVSLMISLAIIFFLLGILDIKSNAAESNTIKFSITREQENINTGAITYYPVSYTLTSESEMEMYVYQSHFERTTEPITTHFFAVSDSPITMIRDSSSSSSTSFLHNGKTRYYIHHGSNYPNTTTWPHFYNLTFETEVNYKSLTTGYYNKQTDFINDYINDNLGFVIDYDSFEIDNNIPVITDMQANRIQNWDSVNSYNQYFDYITWVNSSDYDIQIKKVFTVYFMRKVDGKIRLLGTEHNPDTVVDEIYTGGTTSFTQQTDDKYILNDRYSDYEYYAYIAQNNEYENWTISKYGFQYAFRYIDVENNKAGRWSLVMPFENIGDIDQTFTFSYMLEDGSNSEPITLGGIGEEFTDLWDYPDGLDYAKDVIDSENEYIERSESEFEEKLQKADLGVEEVSNWLYAVVGFIKNTPQVVGSVLAFLPRPILYGMYVCIFLGVIASGLAIVKALL